MDIATVIGLVLAFGAVLGGFVMEGGKIGSLFAPSALIIVMGGSLGATVIAFAMRNLVSVPLVLKQAFFPPHSDPVDMVRTVVSLAKRARQAGILSLEAEARDIHNKFVRGAIQMVVDGTQPELVREVLETEVAAMRERHKAGVEFFTAWGGFSPTLGVLGTVMGLVEMMENLDDPGGMGPAIAMAFIATLYGVGFANLFLLPMASKLKNHSHEEVGTYEMIIEGILALQAGDNPRVVANKMKAFLAPSAQKVLDAEEA